MQSPDTDPTTRFSDRVKNYVLYRPGYPDGVLQILRTETGLVPESVVADVGSGTGISSRIFLHNGNTVFGVEPNSEMRKAAEDEFRELPSFHSVSGTAESTTLAPSSVDYVVAGQAFHWFDRQKAQREFVRIIRSDGWVVLLWNARRSDSSAFLASYEALLVRYGTDYKQVNHRGVDEEILKSFFDRGEFVKRRLDNQQLFDFDGLKGRLLSSSYTPPPDHANYELMLQELERVFETHKKEGKVCVEYDTVIYFGHVA